MTVASVDRVTPRLVRVAFAGAELEGFSVEQPGASVRLLLPSPGTSELVVPAWNGNEFLLADGQRPVIRTFTPLRADPDARELDLEVVIHGHGVASAWADVAERGMPAAISGPGRGYVIDANASDFLLAGDETAIPAIGQLLGELPPSTPTYAHIEVAHSDGRAPLPDHQSASVTWHDLPPDAPPGDALVAAVQGAAVGGDTRVWVAGEAAAVQRVRRYLFQERGFPRAHATVRGYWKHGRAGDADDDE